MKTPDPVVTVIAKSLPSFHPLVRYAERLGGARHLRRIGDRG